MQTLMIEDYTVPSEVTETFGGYDTTPMVVQTVNFERRITRIGVWALIGSAVLGFLLFLTSTASAQTSNHKLGNAKTMSAQTESICAETSSRTENKVCVERLQKEAFAAGDKALETLKAPNQRPFITDSNPEIILKLKAESYVSSATISLTAYDAEDNSVLWTESRTYLDMRNDVAKLFNHFAQARVADREAEFNEQNEILEKQRIQSLKDDAARLERQCETDFTSLKQNIIAYVEVQHVALPQNVIDEIAAHNKTCTNQISVEVVQHQEKAEADAKTAQARAAKLEALRQKHEERLAKEKADAFAAYTHLLSDSPLVPPAGGWTYVAGLGNGNWYIILPGGRKNDCQFAAGPSLNCLTEGQNNYVAVTNNGRYYLLKGKYLKHSNQQYATSLKDGGLTMCLKGTGCYPVLAEVRQAPTELPEKYSIPAPSQKTAVYENGEYSVSYPQDWRSDEKRDKNGVLTQVSFANPAARLGSWFTHGVFIGHALSMAKGYPTTLDGAFDQITTAYHLNSEMTFTENSKLDLTISGQPARLVVYSQPSIFTTPERGYIVVIKDKSLGFYYLTMFLPGNDDGQLYQQTFTAIYNSIKFK